MKSECIVMESRAGSTATRSHRTLARTASARAPRAKQDPGFTIVTVLIVLAIVSIVATIALPIYTDQITRSKIIAATTDLADMRARIERYAAAGHGYPTSCIPAAAGPPPPGKIYLPANSKYFTLSCSLAATTYTVTAVGDAGEGMAGFVYTIDQADRRQTLRLPTGWSGAEGIANCWVTTKDGDC